jgi:signal transduction histidine kinase
MTDSFQHYAKNSPDALASFDATGRLVYANQSFVNLFMRGLGRIDACSLDDLAMSRSFHSALAQSIESALHNGAEERFTREEHIDAAQRRFLCRVIPVQEPGNEQTVLVELRDETELMELQDALLTGHLTRRQAEHLKGRRRRLFFGVLDDFPGFVYMQRQDYTVAYANRKVRNLYGETESRLCYEVFAGRKKPCLVCPTFEVFETGQPVEWEFVDHKGRTFRIYDYPFEDETGEPLVMELGIDVTDLKRVEKELFQAQKLRAIGVLAGGMAHDLNNNLVPIIFNIDHVLNKTRDKQTREPLEEALQAAYRAARLVEQVLEYSCRQDVSRTTLHLTPLLRENIEMFRSALPEAITLDVDLDGARSDCAYANPAQMQQIILNLLRNAEQAISDGGAISITLGEAAIISRETSRHSAPSPGEYITLRVQDTGVGIQAEDIDRIFEPFFTTKKSKGGTGMGLAVVHSIVSSSGGAIEVDSIPGMGAAFTVYLPKAHPPAEQVSCAPSEIDGRTGRLLLVDDNHGALFAMARTLREAGFDVDTAHSGEEGIAKFVKAPHRYNLVLADQSMPGVSGMEMSLQMLAVNEDVNIIICAGHLEPTFKKHARDAGIAGFAMKPMTPSTLVKMVQKHCS